MIYIYIGLVVVFAIFTIWALVSVNSFKGKPKEKKEEKPPVVQEPTFEVSKEKVRPKKVKIKREKPVNSKGKDGPTVVPVFEGEESAEQPASSADAVEKDKDELYRKYVEENGENSQPEPKNDRRSALSTEEDIERRIASLKKQAEEREIHGEQPASNNDYYYGYGTGQSARSKGSMKDPNFNPWPDEVDFLERVKREERKRAPIFDEDEEDDFDVIERLMNSRRSRPEPTSRIGGNSVRSNLGRTTARDMIVGQTLAERRGNGNRRTGLKPIDTDGDKQ